MILKITLITQNKQNVFCFRFKKKGGGTPITATEQKRKSSANQYEEKA